MRLKIKTDEFRVKQGDRVNLAKWPTVAKPIYKTKAAYRDLLDAQVDELSALLEILYASDRYKDQTCRLALLDDRLPGDGCRGQGRGHQTRHVGH